MDAVEPALGLSLAVALVCWWFMHGSDPSLCEQSTQRTVEGLVVGASAVAIVAPYRRGPRRRPIWAAGRRRSRWSCWRPDRCNSVRSPLGGRSGVGGRGLGGRFLADADLLGALSRRCLERLPRVRPPSGELHGSRGPARAQTRTPTAVTSPRAPTWPGTAARPRSSRRHPQRKAIQDPRMEDTS